MQNAWPHDETYVLLQSTQTQGRAGKRERETERQRQTVTVTERERERERDRDRDRERQRETERHTQHTQTNNTQHTHAHVRRRRLLVSNQCRLFVISSRCMWLVLPPMARILPPTTTLAVSRPNISLGTASHAHRHSTCCCSISTRMSNAHTSRKSSPSRLMSDPAEPQRIRKSLHACVCMRVLVSLPLLSLSLSLALSLSLSLLVFVFVQCLKKTCDNWTTQSTPFAAPPSQGKTNAPRSRNNRPLLCLPHMSLCLR